MCFIDREGSRYRAELQQCMVICREQVNNGIVSIVKISHIVVCQNMNYTFIGIHQSDNAMVSGVGDLLAKTFPHEKEGSGKVVYTDRQC